MNYTGSAYLNHFSATLNSMVTQISSPVASIVLLSFPTLNVSGQLVAAGPCVGGVLLLLIGSMFYTLWEQGSRRREEQQKKLFSSLEASGSDESIPSP